MDAKTSERAHTSPEIQECTLPHERTDDTDSTATNSSDEFDWSEDEEAKAKLQVKTKRGRRLWLAFVKLARPVRVVLISFVGVAISVTPLLVVDLRFPHSAAKTQVHVWSLWITIIWAVSCITYLVVDLIPRFVIAVTWFFGGKTERLKFQVEVCPCLKPHISRLIVDQLIMAVMPWLKLLLDIAWALIALSVLQAVYSPQGTYWTIINRVMQVRSLAHFNKLYFSQDFIKGSFGCIHHCLRGEIVFALCSHKFSPESACRSPGGKQTWVKGIGQSF
jgi:hypothetical protein